MFGDEREELLREVASLGNLKAVLHYLHGGVNVNSSNKVNGWTALHWSSHRGHEEVTRALLANGADISLVTSKGQTAADLAKTDEVRSLFGEPTVAAEPELSFVPRYLREPDLDKLWSVPDENAGKGVDALSIAKSVEFFRATAPPVAPVAPFPAAVAAGSGPAKELLVYLSTRTDDALLGSVFAEPDDTIETTVQRVKEEMVDLPPTFSIAKHTGKMSIPVTFNQYAKKTMQHFRGEVDAIVVVPPKSA
ncbi:hypothetical protein BC938DRAFT_483250 [Jimgerdemannia flammicorona]|uniref:Uncharacterized protein n=1 Tax=Jimgerdemannia flammicorona TaxID=994334 RepID=A0A433QVS2_9FUNG|nr:hypothetical protein BC938DRAFT_483250 [Jimgerdemannia flammicorona]